MYSKVQVFAFDNVLFSKFCKAYAITDVCTVAEYWKNAGEKVGWNLENGRVGNQIFNDDIYQTFYLMFF